MIYSIVEKYQQKGIWCIQYQQSNVHHAIFNQILAIKDIANQKYPHLRNLRLDIMASVKQMRPFISLCNAVTIYYSQLFFQVSAILYRPWIF